MEKPQGNTILHVDMDAFFASVEQLDRPELKGKPVIVGGRPRGRGVVSAASYEARVFGVHSAMPLRTAQKLCPQGIFLPVRFERYAFFSKIIREIFHRYTPMVEPLSSDEAFLDVHGSEALFGTPEEIGRKIKEDIFHETKLTASVGVAPNKFLAKLASDLKKPDGFVVLPLEKIPEILHPLPVGKIWGVGRKAEARLHAFGYRTIRQIAQSNPIALQQAFGDWAHHLWELANGKDSREVTPDRVAKSLSTDTTFAQDIDDPDSLREILFGLVEHLGGRLRRKECKAMVLEVKLRSSDFTTKSCSRTLTEPMDQTLLLWKEAQTLLEQLLKQDLLPARLLSVGASRLARPGQVQGSLFDTEENQKQTGVDTTVDAIKEKFGPMAIQRGLLIENGGKGPLGRQKKRID